ncbi:MAG: 2-oxoglutarate dehydrogenase E1 component [Magnetococcales bacterium]|nr:2-oxoglutarate dehydrogenase E1 component [Magnetococcales bacterium]
MAISDGLNLDYLDSQYQNWKQDSSSVSSEWRIFFEGFELGLSSGGPLAAPLSIPQKTNQTEPVNMTLKQSKVEALKAYYREYGHYQAWLNPLDPEPPPTLPDLELANFSLTEADLNTEFVFRSSHSKKERAPLRDIISHLKKTYCGTIGVEFMHLHDPKERDWLRERMEAVHNRPKLTNEAKIRVLNKLMQSTQFEKFLNKKFPGTTRFSLEGSDGMIPMIDALLNHAGQDGCEEVIIGIAHRGRLNLLGNVLNKDYSQMFREFFNRFTPSTVVGSGDVKYHNGFLVDLTTPQGHNIEAFLVNNPSHLESVNPVVEGIVRARQERRPEADRYKVLPLLIHGDSAFAGQGVVSETLNLSQVEGYRTQGTVHIILNNQVGFTTTSRKARSTHYCTDQAKMLSVPIFHVNGEDPEAFIHSICLAWDYRHKFRKDAVVDLICYRRQGHNEGDEPFFTQPQMYTEIKKRQPLAVLYSRILMAEGIVTQAQVDVIANGVTTCMQEAFDEAEQGSMDYVSPHYYPEWKTVSPHYDPTPINTRIDREQIIQLARKLYAAPKGFNILPKLKRILQQRLQSVEAGTNLDWAIAEALSFASLVTEGIPVRLSGQDSCRGTFSHRHSVMVDMKNGSRVCNLNHLSEDQAPCSVYDSTLSEFGVLGFEYGYSTIDHRGLVMWEAQFGDFANNAQAIIDLYICSGQTKWQRLSALTLLLPHGSEGLGPEHSSARLERFLQQCAEHNIQVCNLTTPAQYFHRLRRQVKVSYRKPLVIMTPKSLLRHPLAVSTMEDLTQGEFHRILDDIDATREAKRLVFCTGKIFFELLNRREALDVDEVAIIRVEQLYPFPDISLKAILAKYDQALEWFWVQEEPQNMGAWSYIQPRLEGLLKGKRLFYVGREESASPATGYANVYRTEQARITDRAIAPADDD